MKMPLHLCLFLAATACNQKPQPVIVNTTTDSIIPVTDTTLASNPYTDIDRIKDSLKFVHDRDSMLAIKPLAVFITDKKGDALHKLIATVIDTHGVTRIPLSWRDTTITKYDKEEMPVSSRQIFKNKRFVIEVFSRYNIDDSVLLFINGRELRGGINMDTSQSGTFYIYNIDYRVRDAAMLIFGDKEYLYIPGGVTACTGRACSVSYSLLYDPVVRKAILLEQFRSEFIPGYDKKTNSPVFVDMYNSWEEDTYLNRLMFSGKVYRIDHAGKIKRVQNKAGEQLCFSAYASNAADTLFVVNGTWPTYK